MPETPDFDRKLAEHKLKALEVELWPIDRPQPYERNPRLIPDVAVKKVAASLKSAGWQKPIVVDEDGVILAGHTCLMAAKSLGMKEVPVHVAVGLTKAQAKAYRVADNRSAQETGWESADLALELADLSTLGYDLRLTGFDAGELAGLRGQFQPDDEGARQLDEKKSVQCPECGHVFVP